MDAFVHGSAGNAKPISSVVRAGRSTRAILHRLKRRIHATRGRLMARLRGRHGRRMPHIEASMPGMRSIVVLDATRWGASAPPQRRGGIATPDRDGPPGSPRWHAGCIDGSQVRTALVVRPIERIPDNGVQHCGAMGAVSFSSP
ncbi:hypothetical protein [Algiphilus sp.]|uniref:hypothetical protein n=1 Tax=Algiphilus sp. TaxID=1872431 RepID=UPI0025BB13EB|nr:hypothetical protein [Algiphilus sp.]MCK5770992.1 hypothetical protein [Algiphilus sp.]